MTNHRIVVTRRGGPETLEFVEEEVPEPGAGEVRVRVLVAGVSAYDVMLRSTWFPGFPRTPFTPGLDVVGVVDRLGAGVTGLATGDRVASMLGSACGGYTENLCLDASRLVPVPAGVDSAEAVCVVVNYLTADLMLHRPGRVQPGERILVHGAAGGVGSALLQLGALEGLEMYGTASTRNQEVVAAAGATPIDYRRDDFVERIKALTGDGVDVVFDPVGGARQLWRSYRALRPGGRLVWFGVAASGTAGVRIIPASLVTNRILALLPDGKKAPLAPSADDESQRESLATLFDLLAAGKIRPLVARTGALAEAARAHELLEAGRVAGKIVLATTAG